MKDSAYIDGIKTQELIIENVECTMKNANGGETEFDRLNRDFVTLDLRPIDTINRLYVFYLHFHA